MSLSNYVSQSLYLLAVTNFIGSAYNSVKSWISNKVNAVGKWLKSLW
ncbi:putative cell-wall-anchored protein SasA (LPXTG motif) [Lactococcus lactis subsp. lactis]|uniref:Putative cell-wall-anchored protein SasA (LPXTG motif) n=1 Tax=Lactococcus lactis subsp. lactis TaxID=1360 RepID=A0A0V8E1F7_LACLL|nr:hypothetical protein [Lactococcus lactis]KSU19497.1 putative cell-wall-anchored protein SasA (LPXTG motif) [Lactococcus lactis subsp. lactis]